MSLQTELLWVPANLEETTASLLYHTMLLLDQLFLGTPPRPNDIVRECSMDTDASTK